MAECFLCEPTERVPDTDIFEHLRVVHPDWREQGGGRPSDPVEYHAAEFPGGLQCGSDGCGHVFEEGWPDAPVPPTPHERLTVMGDENLVERLREGHRRGPYRWGTQTCFRCTDPWPCPSILAADRLERLEAVVPLAWDFLDAATTTRMWPSHVALRRALAALTDQKEETGGD